MSYFAPVILFTFHLLSIFQLRNRHSCHFVLSEVPPSRDLRLVIAVLTANWDLSRESFSVFQHYAVLTWVWWVLCCVCHIYHKTSWDCGDLNMTQSATGYKSEPPVDYLCPRWVLNMAALKKMPGRACSRHEEDCNPLERGSTNSQVLGYGSQQRCWNGCQPLTACGQTRTSGLQLTGRAPA